MKELTITVSGGPKTGKTVIANFIQQKLLAVGVESHLDDRLDNPTLVNKHMESVLDHGYNITIKTEQTQRQVSVVEAGL